MYVKLSATAAMIFCTKEITYLQGTSESASADSLNDEGETAASAQVETMNNDEDKNVEGLVIEISKSKEAFDKNKTNHSNKIVKDEAGAYVLGIAISNQNTCS